MVDRGSARRAILGEGQGSSRKDLRDLKTRFGCLEQERGSEHSFWKFDYKSAGARYSVKLGKYTNFVPWEAD
jgi:hypothetical protein